MRTPHSIRRTPLPFILGIRSFESFKVDDLAIFRAVTSEQNPPSLRGAPPVHTRSFALAVRWDFK